MRRNVIRMLGSRGTAGGFGQCLEKWENPTEAAHLVIGQECPYEVAALASKNIPVIVYGDLRDAGTCCRILDDVLKGIEISCEP